MSSRRGGGSGVILLPACLDQVVENRQGLLKVLPVSHVILKAE